MACLSGMIQASAGSLPYIETYIWKIEAISFLAFRDGGA